MTSQRVKRQPCATKQTHNGSMPQLICTKSMGREDLVVDISKVASRWETSMSSVASSASAMVADIARVIVVGAGPTGLTAALELAHRGCPASWWMPECSVVMVRGRLRCIARR
jgi:NADH dehydrogenase FAD-containing subunit